MKVFSHSLKSLSKHCSGHYVTTQACTLISWGCVHLRWCGSLDDYTLWWKYFQRYWPFACGNPLLPGDTPLKDQWRGALMFSDLRLNKPLRKQSRRRWFETLSRGLLRHCNVMTWFPCWHTSRKCPREPALYPSLLQPSAASLSNLSLFEDGVRKCMAHEVNGVAA